MEVYVETRHVDRDVDGDIDRGRVELALENVNDKTGMVGDARNAIYGGSKGNPFGHLADVDELVATVKDAFCMQGNLLEMLESQSPWMFSALPRSAGSVTGNVALALYGLACGFLHCSHLIDKKCFPLDGEWTDPRTQNKWYIQVALALASDLNWAIQIGTNNLVQSTETLWIDLIAGRDRCGQHQMTADRFIDIFRQPCLFLAYATRSGRTRMIGVMTERLQSWFGEEAFPEDIAVKFIRFVSLASRQQLMWAAREIVWCDRNIGEAKAEFIHVLLEYTNIA